VVALQRHLNDAVAGVIKTCAEHGIDADIHAGGTLAVATNAAQLARLRAELAEDRTWGLGEEDEWQLGAAETTDRVAVAGAIGGLYNRHCARIQPAKLVRGLADAVERRGVPIYENSPAMAVAPDRVRTPAGDVRAAWVVLATEGYTPTLPGYRRRLLPMNSSMIVTEPLPQAHWDQIGWSGRETLRDAAHVYIYAQRTADGRIALGGRGLPYRFGSRFEASGATPSSTTTELAAALARLSPPRAPRPWPRPGAGCWEWPVTGARPSASPGRAVGGWPGPAAMSATASPPRTWPVTPWPI
jgi:glycine/D-amino acid oxidase-like deaminating enzyme